MSGDESTNPQINRDTPLRLADAVKIAFPMGGMTVSGLRREAARGRLVIEKIAGKDFVTLQAIEEMRERCRVQPNVAVPYSASNAASGARPRPSETDRANAALAALEKTARELSAREAQKRAAKNRR